MEFFLQEKPKVAIIKTEEHETLFAAIEHCIDLLGKGKILNAKKILLKPNCLQDNPDAATNPEVIRNRSYKLGHY